MAEDLTKLVERLSADESFRERVEQNKEVLSELGWKPEKISAFQMGRSPAKSMCGKECGCVPESGSGCKPQRPGYCCDSNGGSQYS
jgi:hypothetical protein